MRAPLLILAGAGTGKTNTLAHRAAHLVLNGVDPARHPHLTFTRRAAQEMIRRAQKIVAEALAERGKMGDLRRGIAASVVGDFPFVGSRILRLYAKHLGLNPNFTVLDRGRCGRSHGRIRHELGVFGEGQALSPQGRLPSRSTPTGEHPLAAQADHRGTVPVVPGVGTGSNAPLPANTSAASQKNNVLDFDDLLLYWHVMMQTPALAQSLSKNFDHVLVDEYQDRGTLQGEIICSLKPDGKGVTVVGDDAQAIYAFSRGGGREYPGLRRPLSAQADMVVLAQNYRSTQQILDCANALMSEGSRQHRKTLIGYPAVHAKAGLCWPRRPRGSAEITSSPNPGDGARSAARLKRHAILSAARITATSRGRTD